MPKLPRLPILHVSRFTLHFSFLFISIFLIAWGSRRLVKEGNNYYAKGKYNQAIEKYRQEGDSPIVRYNLGNAFYRQQKYKKAIEEYNHVLVTEDRDLREKAYYNIGNAQFRLGVLQSAIRSYKNALRLNPNDRDAKYNLEYALRELERRRQDSFSESNDRKASKKNQNKQSAGGKGEQEKTKSAQKSKASKEDIKRVLNAIRKEEKELQKKLLYRKLLSAKNKTIEKDW